MIGQAHGPEKIEQKVEEGNNPPEIKREEPKVEDKKEIVKDSIKPAETKTVIIKEVPAENAPFCVSGLPKSIHLD